MIPSRTWHSVPTILWVFTLTGFFLPLQGMAQTASVVQLVDNSDLPSGDGLAAKFASDSQLNQHAAVIFTDDFENGELGAKWDETNDRTGNVLSFVDPPSTSPMLGRRSLIKLWY